MDEDVCQSAAESYEPEEYQHECMLDHDHDGAHKCHCGEEW